MNYETWLVDGELSDEAFDWASDFSDEYTGEATVEAISNALPVDMSDELKGKIADVVLGLAEGAVLMLSKPSSD